MTDLDLQVGPAGDITVVDLWDDTVPAFDAPAIQVEPRRWWVFGPADPGEAGAAAPIGGGMVCVRIAGDWRALLMVSGIFDFEDPAFGPGDVAATVIHHVPVWVVPAADGSCAIYFRASLAAGLVELWRAAIARGLVAGVAAAHDRAGGNTP